ncbi:MFS transporter [Burkholderia metallica]|uniref:MFS transporter n=1 Tax=Burkholderia metallica TaxID=488729 RepID=UPI003AAACCC9
MEEDVSHAEAQQYKEGESAGLLAFYRGMTVPERRTFWGCAVGWTLDGMDVLMFPLILGTIMTLWKVDAGQAGLAATITLVTSAVGGWIAGLLSDRIGRVKTLQLTIVWFSFFSLVCAFAQNFNQLIVARALLGLGFGGEWATGAVLIGEVIRARYRGRAVGCVQSGYAVGWGLAVLSQMAMYSLFSPAEAWRWMLAIGAVPALLVLYVRRYVEEPAVSRQSRARLAAQGSHPKFWEIFGRSHIRSTVTASLVTTGGLGGNYAIMTWLPHYLATERHVAVNASSGYLGALIFGSFIGYLAGAYLADAIGRRKLFLAFSAGAMLIVFCYTLIPLSGPVLWVLGFPLGFLAFGYFSGMGAFLTEMYPTRLRGSGQGFCYNFGRGAGALCPWLVGQLAPKLGFSTSIALFSIGAYALFFVGTLFLPETAGKELMAD